MRFRLTGDFAELKRFERQLRKAPDSLLTVNRNLAEETLDLIREGFEKQQDPYGKGWKDHAPLTEFIRPGGRILEDTGGLKGSWSRREVSLNGFRVASHKQTGIYHQRGTGIHGPRGKPIEPVNARTLRVPTPAGPVFLKKVAGSPKRQMVPDRGLPERWRRRYVDTAQEVLTELFR